MNKISQEQVKKITKRVIAEISESKQKLYDISDISKKIKKFFEDLESREEQVKDELISKDMYKNHIVDSLLQIKALCEKELHKVVK